MANREDGGLVVIGVDDSRSDLVAESSEPKAMVIGYFYSSGPAIGNVIVNVAP